jgi:dTDP-4-amino-4,6-dideoxygalactose transaminase
MTFVATAAAIRYTGARPVFVDIDPISWNICPERLAEAITPRTKAVMPVHLHGRLADMSAIMAVAARHGIPVIEDAAQAHGAELSGARAGSFGSIGCFSFYPGKNLGACGEGGAVVTDDDGLAARIRQMRDWGQTQRYYHDLPGYNYRMDSIQGAVLDVKLKYIDKWTELRQAAARQYDELFADRSIDGVVAPAPAAGREHVYHVYAIRSPRRDELRRALTDDGIMTNIHYPRAVHLQKVHEDLGYGLGDFPQAEAFARETLSLPIYPELTSQQIGTVVDAVERHALSGSTGPTASGAGATTIETGRQTA